MTRLQEKLTADQERALRSITARRRESDQVVFIPPEAMIVEKSFEEKVQEWYPTHYDIRKRPR